MDKLKTQRTSQRAQFTKVADKLKEELVKIPVDEDALKLQFEKLESIFEKVTEYHQLVLQLVLDNPSGYTQEAYDLEDGTHEHYQDRFKEIELKYKKIQEYQSQSTSSSGNQQIEGFRKRRDGLRATLDKEILDIEAELNKPDKNLVKLQVSLICINNEMTKMAELDESIMTCQMCDPGSSNLESARETEEAVAFNKKIETVKLQVEKVIPVMRPGSPVHSISGVGATKKSYTLPKIEMKKFDGDLKQWLPFWAQFQKIHEDDELDNADKFQYLIQCMIVNSRAYEVVTSYPQTGPNYHKVIEALRSRYGQEDLLRKVYIRELIHLIILNANAKDKPVVSQIYDKLESHLRSLESLGVTTSQNHLFLYPMVESCLSSEVLRAWERDPLSTKDGSKENPPRNELDYLLEFLFKEVKSEERIKLAHNEVSAVPIKKMKIDKKTPEDDGLPTAAGLFQGQGQSSPATKFKHICIFCDKPHESLLCYKAQRMSYQEKKAKCEEKKACLRCLRNGHFASKCKSSNKCMMCQRNHATLMCPDADRNGKPDKKTEKSDKIESTSTNLSCTADVIMETLYVLLICGKATKRARLLFDNGSQKSYIRKRTAEFLKMKKLSEVSLWQLLFGGSRELVKHNRYQVEIKGLRSNEIIKFNVLDQEKICPMIPRAKKGPWMKELQEKQIWIEDLGDDCPDIEILVGSDHYQDLLTGRRHKLSNGLWAIETKLGWTLSGSQNKSESSNLSTAITNMVVNEASVTKLWDLEVIGIKDPIDHKTQLQKDLEATEHFRRTVSRDQEGRYSISLPFVEGSKLIPSNRAIAERRLQTTTQKLNKEGQYILYDNIFTSWLEEGFIEEVINEDHKPCHYLPHRPIFKPESVTTPVRPVFDASCKGYRSPSLNECLQKGPNLLEVIPSILLKFREKNVGGIGDIRKAFQMIDVQEEDRDYLRFLWWKDETQKEIRVFRHRRVVFGLNCSPYLLGAVIEKHLTEVTGSEKKTAEHLLESFYVDNCVFSVDTIEEYQKFKFEATAIMDRAKMVLREWECGFVETPGVGQLNSRGCGLGVGEDTSLKSRKISSVLGYKWDREQDTISVDLDFDAELDNSTKRKFLSLQQMIYDPIGVACPALLPPKLLLQETWTSKLKWDEKVPEELETKFRKWVSEIKFLGEIKIPRQCNGCITSRELYELHIFCDASKYAYAAVVFLRVQENDRVSVQLLSAKSRVSPMNKPSIPRLELLGCTIGARLVTSVQEGLRGDTIPTVFWSDSTTALAWVRRNDEWGTFVGNRVKEICKLTKVEDWRYVPGKMNPADLPSRGCSPKKLLDSRWWEGPDWLKQSRDKWPSGEPTVNEDLVNEEKKKSKTVVNLIIEGEVWYCRKSRFSFNVKIMGWMLRFIRNKFYKKKLSSPFLLPEEIATAETAMWRMVQKEAFPNHKDSIMGLLVKKGKDNLIHVNSKILRRDDLTSFREPILLPARHPLVEQLIREEHLSNCHAGTQYLLSKLREKYWIVRGRKTIRRVVNSCLRCKRYKLKNVEVRAAPLPEDRVKDSRVFEIVGVDFAGPLYTKDDNKVWFCLFTCSVYRCIHLELVSSLSTSAFLDALTRFISRRGRPTTIYSDNGTNFVGADNIFRTLEWKAIQEKVSIRKIRWIFNPPSAPWWGGWWERIIRMVKDLLRRMLGRAKLTVEKLTTCLCEIEAVINGRPLTYVSEDPEDLTPLTPAMFLHEIPDSWTTDLQEVEAANLQEKLKRKKTIRQELRDRFRKEYLGMLIQRGLLKNCRDLKVGDIVLLGVDNKKRLDWPLGRIMEVFPGADGIVRVVKLKTTSGVFTRPAQRLYHLEVSSPEDFLQPEEPNQKDATPGYRTRLGRLIRVPSRFNE